MNENYNSTEITLKFKQNTGTEAVELQIKQRNHLATIQNTLATIHRSDLSNCKTTSTQPTTLCPTIVRFALKMTKKYHKSIICTVYMTLCEIFQFF